MRFICDVHIPPSLVLFFRAHGFEAIHVFEIGLHMAPDDEIWDYARSRNAIVITKDKDFVRIALANPGPRLILVRIGNSTAKTLRSKFEQLLPDLIELLENGDRVIELR